MKFIHRLGLYLSGFAIGLVLLFFFLSGKKTSCDYSPNARTLKNIQIKKRAYSENAIRGLNEINLDTSAIATVLKNGEVLFSESDVSLDSCRQYVIKGEVLEKMLKIRVENCAETATVLEVGSENK